MARKKGASMDTRGALLDAAVALFAERGFDAASVDAIVSRAGLSKGTFFHFFPTKQAVLEAAAERLASQGWETVRPALEAAGDPLQRLAAYLAESRRFKLAHASGLWPLWEALAAEGNARIQARVRARRRELGGPALSRLIEEGNRAGRFDVRDPEATAQLLLELVDASADGTLRLLREGGEPASPFAERRVNATLEAVERILGAERGALERVTRAILEPFAGGPGKRKGKRP